MYEGAWCHCNLIFYGIFRLFGFFEKECLRVKEQAVLSASEAAEMIMRVDSIVKCAPRKRER